ncbi:MAG: hypothetical protein EOP02_10755 [Proteobacteria bacterium]|nr:MAG: hypothetical protein EOP02_10755 [Pseudomonadota bacterium]
MSHGFFTNTIDGSRVLDNSQPMDGLRIVPQLVARYDLANYAYTDYPGATGAQPGYTLRIYNVDTYTPTSNRKVIRFSTLPANGQDVWGSGVSIQFAPGSVITHPKIYVFALDYVTASSAQWGFFMWHETTGALLYDSGNLHLSLNQLFNIDINTAVSGTASVVPDSLITSAAAPLGAFPASPAFCLPSLEMYRYRSNRVDGREEWRASPFFRVSGASLQARMMRTEYEANEVGTINPVSIASTARGTDLPVLCIDTANYD